MYTKKNARVTFKSNRKIGFKRSSNFSNGKVRNKGNIAQQYNKYLKLAKESFTSGDRIQSEYYYQFTDHYYRLMIELGINIEDNDTHSDTSLKQKKVNKITKTDNTEEDEKEIKNTELNSKDEEDIEEESLESIESIPFIAEPAKKKRITSTK